MTSLPPAPENMNADCAAWAARALRSFQSETGTDDESALTNLLCDFMHWSDRNGGDFERALSGARMQYEAETTPNPAENNGRTVTIVRTTVAPPSKLERLIPYWLRNIHKFVALDTQPHLIMRGSSCGDYLEPCRPQDAEAWMVNGRYPSGHPEPFEHFETAAEAAALCDQLIAIFPHLAGRNADRSVPINSPSG